VDQRYDGGGCRRVQVLELKGGPKRSRVCPVKKGRTSSEQKTKAIFLLGDVGWASKTCQAIARRNPDLGNGKGGRREGRIINMLRETVV